MSVNKPSYLLFLLTVCGFFSALCAGLHCAVIKAGLLADPVYLAKRPTKRFSRLRLVWHARLVRRIVSLLVRTPLRKGVLRLVNFNVPLPGHLGCILVTCHSPWKRLLVQWCLDKNFALFIGGGKWNDERERIQRQGRSVVELRELIKYLQEGGRVVIKAEVFNTLNDCRVSFLGKRCNASRFAERLAILAHVPIQTLVVKLSNNAIELSAGPQFFTEGLNAKSTMITTQVLSFFEKEIERNPAILSNYVR
ncbi:hypothetical protein [Flavisolibacter ginsenosidimutans]|uniref:Uncharacterized protein n=1 Tax=Flavisolibacter ginsenosidimutans TaxID=661481 RepID=A0A5B8UND5_9BACT|nr:hypothetical protein [Flavisolibacter ginsenosidimutans]QEC57966.1 hypothetical protein FSB75_19320 [Flavisolibacter ginsenosidimutans]